MASQILHITNGDSTTKLLEKLNFKDSIITWREMLCEGKTSIDVGSENFWKMRFDFFNTSYKTSKRTFINRTVREYRNLCKEKKQDEIVLWFEYDLFCQINMLAVISWLKRYRKDRKISLVCSGNLDGKKGLFNLQQLTTEELTNHYHNRTVLTQDDIEYADYIWQLYCSDSPLRLEAVYKFNPMSPFVYLEKAIKVHLQRFPSINNGLNKIENHILKTASLQQYKNQKKLVQNILANQDIYGFGDTQYINKLEHLKKLFSSFTPIKLSRIGKKVLDNQINYYGKIRSDFSYLGGSKKYSYLYVNETDKLLKITS
jgi:hypothetical protein